MVHRVDEFVARCRSKGLDDAAIQEAIEVVEGLQAEARGPSGTLSDAALPAVESFIARRLAKAGDAGLPEGALLAMARYFVVIGRQDAAIRLLAYVNPVGVLPAMADRLDRLEGAELRDRVVAGVRFPAPGSPPEAYPAATARFVTSLVDELGKDDASLALAWNVHGIPASAFEGEKARLRELGSIDAWLADRHERQVAELARHAADGTLWFEQAITPAVVEFVRARPEIQAGVRQGDRIYTTKIPYDPAAYLASGDPLERRRLACHCPLAASSITADGAGVPAVWCACSAGYTKFMFDVVFGEETKAEVVASVLAGDDLCRFAIRIPESMKAYLR